MNPLPYANVKLDGDMVIIKITNEDIAQGLKSKLNIGTVKNIKHDNEFLILEVDLSDISNRYNEQFKRTTNIEMNAIEICPNIIEVKINRKALKLMLEKLFKGMNVVDYGEGFEISGRIELPTGGLPNVSSQKGLF